MTNYYVTYTLKTKEDRDNYYREVRENGIIDKSRAEDGCIRYEYYYPAESETEMFLWEQLESREAQKKHTQQPHFEVLGKLKEKYGVDADILVEDQIVNAVQA